MPQSIVERFIFQDREFFVKRDDLIDPLFSGNKYRKLYSLIHCPAAQYQAIISYGGTQSNAMLSIAALCQRKGWQFHYTTKTVPERIKAAPDGNLALALKLGMQLHSVDHADYQHVVEALHSDTKASHLLLPQGAADPIAEAGIAQLAQEIRQWQGQNAVQKLHLITPSGTGTTAFYLARALPDADVLSTACVGDKAYLISQMSHLGAIPENLHMLENNKKKFHFAKPYPELLSIYHDLKQAGIEFDLLYGCPMWFALLQHAHNITGTILYVHSGGLPGNETMLARYRHKGFMQPD
ncbi:MAG: pyridoxal-phosphate dependent enzyme [Mariprofundus sp.]|nr:pyridoxal-phosphate dependent enzyme [Mariprofundus sp.]